MRPRALTVNVEGRWILNAGFGLAAVGAFLWLFGMREFLGAPSPARPRLLQISLAVAVLFGYCARSGGGVQTGNLHPPPSLASLFAARSFGAAAVCAGDCDGDGGVSAAEIVLAVQVSLGRSPAGACAAADGDGDGTVSIDDLLAAVVSSFTACGSRPAPSATASFTATTTPTPTHTPTPTASLSPSATPTPTPAVRVAGLWHEDAATVVASNCDALVERVRDQLLPLPDRDLRVSQEGARVVFEPTSGARSFEGRIDDAGVVAGTTLISQTQQGCVTRLEARFTHAMGASPADGEYVLSWEFSSGCRPLADCEQRLRSRLTRLS